MIQYGQVVETGEKAKIRISRESACGGNCGACKGCDTNLYIEVERENLNVGDGVKIILDDKIFRKNILLGYGGLTLFMIVGGIMGWYVVKTQLGAVLSFSACFGLGLLILKRFKNKTEYVIEKIGEEN